MIESPCVNICELNQYEICKGCGRTKTEVAVYGYADDLTKYMINEKALVRMKTMVERMFDDSHNQQD